MAGGATETRRRVRWTLLFCRQERRVRSLSQPHFTRTRTRFCSCEERFRWPCARSRWGLWDVCRINSSHQYTDGGNGDNLNFAECTDHAHCPSVSRARKIHCFFPPYFAFVLAPTFVAIHAISFQRWRSPCAVAVAIRSLSHHRRFVL